MQKNFRFYCVTKYVHLVGDRTDRDAGAAVGMGSVKELRDLESWAGVECFHHDPILWRPWEQIWACV